MKTMRHGLVLLPVSLGLVALIACSAVPFAERATSTPAPTATRSPTVTAAPARTSTRLPFPTLTPTPGAAGSGKELALRLNFFEGEVYRIRMVAEQTIEQSQDGERLKTKQRVGYEYQYSIVSVDPEGNAWMEVLYTWALLEQDNPMGKIEYDSSNPPAEIPPGAEGFSVLVGHGFSVQVTPQGNVLEIRGLEELYQNMMEALNFEDPQTEAQFLKLFREQFGEEAMKGQCGNLTAYLPEEPVQVGESWTARREISLMVPIIIDSTYTLTSQEGNLATIAESSTISPGPEAEFMDLGVAKLGYSLSGKQEGVTRVDTATGLGDSEYEQTLSGVMILLIDEEQTTIPVFIKSVTHIETVLEK